MLHYQEMRQTANIVFNGCTVCVQIFCKKKHFSWLRVEDDSIEPK
jgi:hypothetical protein